VVVTACLLLFARAIHFTATGSAARLRTIPRLLAYAEIPCDATAAALAFWAWVRPQLFRRRTGGSDRMESEGSPGRLAYLGLIATFALHTVRMAIYISPGRGVARPQT
jgi:hypothetical protein